MQNILPFTQSVLKLIVCGTLVDNAIAKLIQRMQTPKSTHEKRMPCGLWFAQLKPQAMAQPLQALWIVCLNLNQF
jgi:hypothetical protein